MCYSLNPQSILFPIKEFPSRQSQNLGKKLFLILCVKGARRDPFFLNPILKDIKNMIKINISLVCRNQSQSIPSFSLRNLEKKASKYAHSLSYSPVNTGRREG